MGDAWEPCELRFSDCRIPAGQLLGELDRGLRPADHQLSHGRLKIASYQLGIAQRCIDEAVAWAQERTHLGAADRLAPGDPVHARRQRGRAGRSAAARLPDGMARPTRARDVRTDAFKAKLFATEMAQRVTDRCLQVFGGRGYAQRLSDPELLSPGAALADRPRHRRDPPLDDRPRPARPGGDGVSGVLDGRCAVVTGAVQGIGRAIAEALAAAGAPRGDPRRRGARPQAATEIGNGAIGVEADVTDASDVQDAFAAVAATLGGIDLLVNNAGIRHQAPIAEHSVEVWRRTIDVNLVGTFICTQAAIALHARARRRGDRQPRVDGRDAGADQPLGLQRQQGRDHRAHALDRRRARGRAGSAATRSRPA